MKIKEIFNGLWRILLMQFVPQLVSFPWWSITLLYVKDEKTFQYVRQSEVMSSNCITRWSLPCIFVHIFQNIFIFARKLSQVSNKKKDAIFYTTTCIGRLFHNHFLQFSEMESKYKWKRRVYGNVWRKLLSGSITNLKC